MKDKMAALVYKTGIDVCGGSAMVTTTKVGTTIRRLVAVAQSVKFACGLKATVFIHMSRHQQ
jgi:hypothetical protein